MKKGQIETGQLLLVVIMVVVLLILGFVGYSYMKTSELKNKVKQFESLGSIDAAQEAASLPELSCGYAESAPSNCVDLYRLKAQSEFFRKRGTSWTRYGYYRDKFGHAKIVVNETYPNAGNNWTVFKAKPGNYSTRIPIRMPVSLYNPMTRTNRFAVMKVVKYS